MATMDYRGVTYTVKYVDPGATGANDGSTVTDALTALPATASLTTLTAYIVRRTATELAWTVGTCAANNVIVIGCPVATDMLADLVPAAVMTAWGADATARAIFLSSSATAGIIFSGLDILVGNIELRSPTSAGSNSTGVLQMTGSRPGGLINVIIKVKSFDITDGSRTALVRRGLLIGGDGVFLIDCEIHGSAEIPVDFKSGSVALKNPKILNTTFKWWDTATAFPIGSSSFPTYNAVVDSCVFRKRHAASNTFNFTHKGDDAVYQNCTWWADFDTTSTGCDYGTSYVLFKNCTWTWQTAASGAPSMITSVRGTFIGCTFTSTASATPTSGAGLLFTTSATPLYFKDCTFSVDFWDGIILGSSNIVNHLENCTFSKGRLTTSRKIKIAALDLTYQTGNSSNFPLILNDQAQVYVVSMTLPASRYLQMNNDAMLFIDSVSNAPNLDFGGSENSAYYCLNEGGVTGNWHAENLRNKITTSSTYRTGSAVTYGYKCEGKTPGSTTCPALYIAPRPYSGIPISLSGTGRHTVTMYFAYKNGTPTQEELYLELEVPAASSGTAVKVISSQESGYIAADSSTWNNDSGLTTKKIVMTFNLLRNEGIVARIGYNKFASSAYVVIDPTLVGA